MNMIEQIKADREAGTSGIWVHDKKMPLNAYSDDVTGSIVATVNGFEYAPRPMTEKVSNARRIARVPDMEAALIAADELANSVQAEFETIGCSALLHSEMMKFRAAIGAT